jgi:phage-related protein
VPTTTIIFFRDEDGSAPFLDGVGRLPKKAKVQCRARLGLLSDHGNQRRRPAAAYLRDGIYELRAKAGRIQYRRLYFFHGRQAVVISHGITKQESAVPPIEIERARRRRQAFEAAPPRHTHTETL